MFYFDLQRFAGIKTVKNGTTVDGLPPATSSSLGGVIVGTGISVDSQGKISVPTATATSNGLMTSTEKSKLSGIASGAEVNVINAIKVNGTSLSVTDKTVDITVPDIDSKVDKVSGKGLSTNDYTTSEKNKLAGIDSGATKNTAGTNVSISNGAINVATGSASTPGVLKVGSNLSVNNGTVSLSSTNVTNALGFTPVSVNTTYPAASTTTNGIMSSTDKKKLDSVTSGAVTGLSVSGKNITYTKGDGTSSVITTQDTTYSTVTTSANGLVPALPNDSTKFLRGDGKWSVPPDTNTTYSGSGGVSISGTVISADSSYLGSIKKGTGTTAYLRADGQWATPTGTTYGTVTGSNAGLAPALAGGTDKYLRADGSWAVPPNTDTNTTYGAGTGLSLSGTTFSANSNYLGSIQKSTGTTNFLRADGTWAVPPGTVTNTDAKVAQNVSTVNSTYPILLAATANATANVAATNVIFGKGVKVNPNTSVITAATFDGTATKASMDSAGNVISTTYLSTTSAASTYLTKTDASSTYLGKTAKAASATTADSATTATTAGSLTADRNISVSLGSSTVGKFRGNAAVTLGVQGTLPASQGGTGLTASPSMLTNLSSTVTANVFAASPRPGVTGTLPISNGGTGATTAANARASLGLGAVATQNTLAVANGGTGTNNLANVSVGSAATAAKLSNIYTINGIPFDGTKKLTFSTVNGDAATVPTKTVTLPTTHDINIEEKLFAISFRYANTADNPSLSVDGDIRPIYRNGAIITTGADKHFTNRTYQSVLFRGAKPYLLGQQVWEIVEPAPYLPAAVGTLPVSLGGTGQTVLSSVTVGKANTLTTARNIVASLGSTVAGSFDGSAAVTVGTQGILPVAKGGTGQTVLSAVTTGAATKASQDGSGNVITTTYAPKASPTFTGEVSAPVIKNLEELQFHFLETFNEDNTHRLYSFTGAKTFDTYSASSGKSMLVAAGQALVLSAGEGGLNAIYKYGTSDSLSGYLEQYYNRESMAIMADQSVAIFTNTADFQNPNKWVFSSDGNTSLPGSIYTQRLYFCNPEPGWVGPPNNGNDINVQVTSNGVTTTTQIANAGNLAVVGANRLFLFGGETSKLSKFSDKVTCLTYKHERKPIWIMPQGGPVDPEDPEGTNASEHVFICADRSVYIYTNLQTVNDINDNSTISSNSAIPHLFSFYRGIFRAPYIQCGTATLNNPLAVTYGGTGATTAADARTNLGLGAVATQNTLAVANGGTGQTVLSAVTVGKANTLTTARNIVASLGSTVAASFDGSAAVTVGTQGTLPVARGGTGLTASPSMLTNLGSTVASNILAASPRPGVTGTLPVANGGTGATVLSAITVGKASSLATARNIVASLGSSVAASFNGSAAVTVGTQGILPVNKGGTGQTDLSNVTVGTANTAGSCTGNAKTATRLANYHDFRVDLSSTLVAAFNGTSYCTPGVKNTLGIANGGTGATTAAAARTALDVPQAGSFASCWYVSVPTGLVDTADKVLTVADQGGHSFSLSPGTTILFYMTEDTTASTVTAATRLNINSTGLKNVRYWTTKSINVANNKWNKALYMLMFNGTYWYPIGKVSSVVPSEM